MWDKLRPFIGKIIAAPIGALFAGIAVKTGVTSFADPEVTIAATGGVLYLVSAAVNTLVNKKVNPSNAATTKQAVEGKVIEQQGTLLGTGNVNTGDTDPRSPGFNAGHHRGAL